MDFPADEAAQIGQLVGFDPTSPVMPCNITRSVLSSLFPRRRAQLARYRLDMVIKIKGVDFPLDPIDFVLRNPIDATQCNNLISVCLHSSLHRSFR